MDSNVDKKIIIDTREQQPWKFPDFEVKSCALKTGDYSLEGYDNIFCIERKGSVTEIAGNVTQKRFERELKRMSEIKHSYILLEFSINDMLNYPVGTNIPYRKWNQLKFNGKFILGRLMRYQIEYGVHILFCETKEIANFIANNLMRYIYEFYNKTS